jgi:hypothetical protein
LERDLEGRDQLLKLVESQAGEIQELYWTGLQVSEPYTGHGWCLLSLYRDIRGASYQKESGINSSDGGIVALTFAKDYPAIPRAIVVYGAAPVQRDLTHYFAGMRRFFAIDTRGPLSEADLNRIAAERPAMVARYRRLHRPHKDPEYWRELLTQIWPMWMQPLAYIVSADLPLY